MTDDERWMLRALVLAQRAAEQGEVPVGAVLVRDAEVIGEGWNSPIGSTDPSAHAEINALRAAAQSERNYRLPGTTLYVTVEPCMMCAGAIVHARIARVVFATREPRTGAAGSVFDVFSEQRLNHRPLCEGGLLAERAAQQLQAFFKARRD